MPPAKRIPRPLRAARTAAGRLHATLAGIERLQADVARLSASVDAFRERSTADQSQLLQILRLLHDAEPYNRQVLWRLRETPQYALAFEEPEPLVSVCMTAYVHLESLMERALPSVLAQTYERLEVVVVGDAAAPEIERAVRGLRDPRVRFANMTLRGPYAERPPDELWYIAGGPPSNEAMRLARGRWIASADDDDASTPDRIERLLAAARERELEFVYGRIRRHEPDGSASLLGEFPPALGQVGLQASLMHTDMRFICAELGDALFHVVGDWSRIRRMMRLGVRMGMIDDVVAEYYPGTLWKRG